MQSKLQAHVTAPLFTQPFIEHELHTKHFSMQWEIIGGPQNVCTSNVYDLIEKVSNTMPRVMGEEDGIKMHQSE